MTTYILYTRNKEAARKEIRDIGGRITQEFTPDLFAATLPDSYDVKALRYARTRFTARLGKSSKLMLKAWKQAQRKLEKSAYKARSTHGLLWGARGLEAPLNQELVRAMTEPATLSALPPVTSRQMTGSVAVGVIIVSGPGDLRFTELQKQKIISEIIQALDFLDKAEPRANLIFHHEPRMVDVGAVPGPITTFESAEAPWRDEALGKMGFATGRQGSVRYVNDLRQRMKTDWAYIAYFTKYPLKSSAYTIQETIVMRFPSDNRKVESMNTVFAHETCHVFGASDEYEPCACNKAYGILRVLNQNCISCAASFVPCLMAGDFGRLCDFTRRQIGWDTTLYP